MVNPKYSVGQKVVIKPSSDAPAIAQRESDIGTYTGQVGEVCEYYWISPRTGQVFYIYNVRVRAAHKELVLYEDELENWLD